MGESMVDKAQDMENKMGVSVSFGKYENDALSWEKWSTFSSPNKYLEEVGKCSTPGSVAQKKAFFEAHYKKIAAMKAEAELLEQEKAETDDSFQQFKEEESKASCVSVNEEEADDTTSVVDDEKPDNDPSEAATSVKDATMFGDESMQATNACASQQHLLLPSCQSLNPYNADKLVEEEAVLVNDVKVSQPEPEIPRPKAQKKVNPTKVEKNNILGMKKKPASLVPKSLEMPPATRLSRPKANPAPIPAAKSSSKKANASKNLSLSENRKIALTSLHLSISMSSVNSDTASSVTSSRRRSLFMEQMGDKDIIKRAFKTFQNRVNQLPPPKQLPIPKASTSMALQKENERSRKAASEKINPSRGRLGPMWKSVSSGSLEGVGVDERLLPTSVVLKSNERAERRKEFLKKLEEKSNAREAERSQLSSTAAREVKKDAEVKKVRQNLTFKAKPMPSFYRTEGVSKSTLEKDAMKNRSQRRPDSHRNISR